VNSRREGRQGAQAQAAGDWGSSELFMRLDRTDTEARRAARSVSMTSPSVCIGPRLMRTNPMPASLLERTAGDTHVVLGLQVDPEARIHTEEQAQTDGGVRGDRPAGVHDVTDAAGRYINVGSQLARGDAHGLHEVLQQNFTGVDLFKQFGGRHVGLFVVSQ